MCTRTPAGRLGDSHLCAVHVAGNSQFSTSSQTSRLQYSQCDCDTLKMQIGTVWVDF